MFIPYIQQRRMYNLQGFGGAPTVIAASNAPARLSMRSASVGSCPTGWQPLEDSNGKRLGCALNAMLVDGLTCDANSPPAFDSAGKQIGCLVPTMGMDAPMMAAVDENGNVIDANGNPITLQVKNAISDNPGKSLAVVALAGAGLGALAFAARQWLKHDKRPWF